jgi:hypothetical protein
MEKKGLDLECRRLGCRGDCPGIEMRKAKREEVEAVRGEGNQKNEEEREMRAGRREDEL